MLSLFTFCGEAESSLFSCISDRQISTNNFVLLKLGACFNNRKSLKKPSIMSKISIVADAEGQNCDAGKFKWNKSFVSFVSS